MSATYRIQVAWGTSRRYEIVMRAEGRDTCVEGGIRSHESAKKKLARWEKNEAKANARLTPPDGEEGR